MSVARVGPKEPATGERAVCSSQHPIVTETMLDVLKDGGNAIDATIAAPRMLPLEEDYTLPVESRIAPEVVAGLARLGVLLEPLPAYDYHMGSFQMSWLRDGLLHSTAGPRRAGLAAGF